MDDARLVALLAVDAAERGARILTRTRLESARRDGGLWTVELVQAGGRRETVRTRALVNAAGPWVDQVLRRTGRNAPGAHAVRLVKGSHVVLPRLYDGPQCYTLQNADGRVVFTIPYEDGRTLVGTTDVPFEGDPAEVRIDPAEAEYLCGVVDAYFRRPVTPADVVWSYSGVRPLADSGQENASAVTRDYVFDLEGGVGAAEGAPLLSIYGGKLTTFRKLAEHALKDLGAALDDRRPAWTAAAKLPGGEIVGGFEAFCAEAAALWPWLPAPTLIRMAHAYGSRLARVLGDASRWSDLGRDFGGGLTAREADHLRREEWARTAEDVLWRRSKLGLQMTAQEQAAFAAWFEGAPVAAPAALV